MNVRFRIIETPTGHVGFVATNVGLRRVFLPTPRGAGLRKEIRAEFPGAAEDRGLIPGLAHALRRYFEGKKVAFDVTFDLAGHGDFHIDVWNACRRLGYGKTGSYKSLAERVGRPGAARAVGTAMKRNPFPIVVPCHRVLKSDGSLGGYSGRGGLALKRRLLDMEAAR